MRLPKNILISITVASALAGMTSGANADLVISKNPTTNMSCSGGICNATAADAVLNVKDLTKMLATSDVEVFAEGVATDITLSVPVFWASSHRLTLGAYGSVNVKSSVTVQGTAGLTITTNVAGGGGEYRLVGVGKISFWDTASSLIINGNSYTLFNDLTSLVLAIQSNPSGNYAFANDYNAAQGGSYPSAPIQTVFHGNFDGLGNAIDKLTIYNTTASAANYGLFAQVESDGQLSNVTLTNFSSQTVSSYVGSVAAVNFGTITHATVTGAITGSPGGNLRAGGLVFNNGGTITRSHAAVNVSNALYEGGLAAFSNGTISLSDASGTVTGGQVAGGLVGESDGTISDSNALGNVSLSLNENAVAGGLAGNATGVIERSFAAGAVSAGTSAPGSRQRKPLGVRVGGLVGVSGAQIYNSYAVGSVTGASQKGAKFGTIGGLVGTNQPSAMIQYCYSTGAVTLLKDRRYSGGSVGYETAPQGANSAVFWDLDTSSVTDPSHGAGNIAYDQGLKGISEDKFRTVTMRNFDPGTWAENSGINNGYPYLISNPPAR